MNATMNKDVSLLKDVSAHFTEQTLKKIIAKERNLPSKDNIEILGWDFGEASAKGDSYLSVVNRVKVQSKINNEIVETKLVIKSLPKSRGRRLTFRSTEFFNNEIVFYNEVAPRFEKYLKSKGQSQLLSIPRCLDCLLDGENDYIVLLDVSTDGYGPVCRQTCLSYEECKYIAECMARFHAISFGYKSEKPEEFDKTSNKLLETFFTERLYETWYKRFHTTVLLRIAKDSLAKEFPGSKAEKVFNSYEPGALVKKSIQVAKKFNSTARAVISQGDAWAPNFLVREKTPGSAKFDVLMLDFQLARCSSPVFDLVFFIYACTDQPMRDQHYHDILKDYYNELIKSMKLLGVDAEKIYPWDVYKQELKELSICGLTFALEAVPFTMMPPEEAFDLDQIKDEKIDISDIWTLSNIQSSENRRRHAEMIVHAVDNGFI